MDLRNYLDATYLKTAAQAGISIDDSFEVVRTVVQEAIDEKFKLVMLRPDVLFIAKEMIDSQSSNVKIGTVIDFPDGTAATQAKLDEAEVAIANGADELDFVCNYQAFKNGNTDLVETEIKKCTELVLSNNRVAKWIIETAALNAAQVAQISSLIKNVILSNFDESQFASVFVKSSTGFYKTEGDLPNGATKENIIMMLENASPLPIKASGGVRNYEDALEMISLGVKRIGTSNAKAIVDGMTLDDNY